MPEVGSASLCSFGARDERGGCPPVRTPDPQAVRARMHALPLGYEKELGTLIAEEHSPAMAAAAAPCAITGAAGSDAATSTPRPDSSSRMSPSCRCPAPPAGSATATSSSVGGRPIRREGAPLEQLLKAQSDDVHERAMVLLLESARHNLGAPAPSTCRACRSSCCTSRNQARFVISAHEMDRSGDCEAMRLDARGDRHADDHPAPRGRQHAEHASPPGSNRQTGRLCRAEVRMRDAPASACTQFDAVVRVEFARDADARR